MERTGGEPDVTGRDKKTGKIIFTDCSKESPFGRRNVVYDRTAQDWLKENYSDQVCNGNAVDMATAMGIQMLSGQDYRGLQKLGEFDTQSWSYIQTPASLRSAGHALTGSRAGGDVHVLRDDARSHVDYRAFRGTLRV